MTGRAAEIFMLLVLIAGKLKSEMLMKVALIFSEVPQAGGAFHQSINAVEQFIRIRGDSFEIELFHPGVGGDIWLDQIGLKSTPLPETWWSKTVEAAIRFLPRSIIRYFKIMSPREKFLLGRGIDLIYFTSPNMLAVFLGKLNYIVTLYDLCHRDFPEFPEIADFATFEARDSYNWNVLARAILVIVDSHVLKSNACRIYGLQDDRVLVMPYGVSHYVTLAEVDGVNLRRKYGLDRPFLFYPAQFWAHKNHVRILQALHLLKQQGVEVDVAFSGGDRGGRAHVEQTALQLGLGDQVRFLGFVPSEDLAGLYSESLALIMPTYFGPTNIPPLEAWSRDVPVIYSKHLSADIGNAVLAIDADSPESIADAIQKVGSETVRQSLIAGGRECLDRVQQEIAAGEAALGEHVSRFARRRQAWEPTLAE
jgi:glycosyltransferase involved in cell wall biosynthesis